jgi:hypothetical protein
MVPVAARMAGVRCIYITDFFEGYGTLNSQAIEYADEIVFTGTRGTFTEPPNLQGRVSYVGRAVRPSDFSAQTRQAARSELGLADMQLVAVVQPGAWTEKMFPIAQIVSGAWKAVPLKPKRLIWIAGSDCDELAAQFAGDDEIAVVRHDWRLDRLIAASNLVITKANRLTVFEAAAAGVPSLSLTQFMNWPDDVAVNQVPTNLSLRASAVDASLLAQTIVAVANRPAAPAAQVSRGIEGACRRIQRHIDAIIKGRAAGAREPAASHHGADNLQLAQ